MKTLYLRCERGRPKTNWKDNMIRGNSNSQFCLFYLQRIAFSLLSVDQIRCLQNFERTPAKLYAVEPLFSGHLLSDHLYKVTSNQSPDGGFCIVFTRSIKPLPLFKRPLSISPVDLNKVSVFTRGLLTSRLMDFEFNTK